MHKQIGFKILKMWDKFSLNAKKRERKKQGTQPDAETLK